MATSTARVITDRPERYAKQLVSHLGRKSEATWDAEQGRGAVRFTFGTSSLVAENGAILLAVEGSPEDLERLESVVGKHLVRFGSKDELAVRWSRGDGQPGTVW